MAPKKILLCTDFSENSEPARALAEEYAAAFGAELIITHVIDSDAFPHYMDWVGDEIDEILARAQKSAEAKLKELARESRKLVPAVKTVCKTGPVPQGIVTLAKEEGADLIVIGTHGRAGVKHLVMGSIARSVLRMAHRPILVVEASGAEGYGFPAP